MPGLALSGLAMLYMGATSFFDLSMAAFVGSFVAVHLAVNIISGNMQTLGTDVAPPHARGRFFGASRLVAQTGSLLSPSSFGLLSALASYMAAFAFLGGSALIGSVIAAVFIRETLRRPPPDTG